MSNFKKHKSQVMIGVLKALGRHCVSLSFGHPLPRVQAPESCIFPWAPWCYLSSHLPLFMPGFLPRLSLFFPWLSVRFSVLCKHVFLSALEHPLFSFCLVSFPFVLLAFLPAPPASKSVLFPSIPDLVFNVIPFLWEMEIDGWRGKPSFITRTHLHAHTRL